MYKRFGLAMLKTIDPVYQPNNALVWRSTLRVVGEWFSEIDNALKLDQTRTVDLLKDVPLVTLLRPSYHPSLIIH